MTLKSWRRRKTGLGITLLSVVLGALLWQVPRAVGAQAPPRIDQGEVTSKTSNSATIDWITPAGEEAALDVTVFYGNDDGGTQENNWQHNAELLPKGRSKAQYQVTLRDLKPRTPYVYRIRATTSAGASWSETATFRTEAWSMPWYLLLAIVVALLAIPFAVGSRLARRFRMPDHGWKIGLVSWSIACGLVIVAFRFPPKLGIDLSGGTILVYEVDQQQKNPNKPVDMDKLVAAVSERVNPGGQKEMTIRRYGAEQIEIVIPRIDPEEAKRVEKIVSRAGTLEFRILANTHDDKPLIDRALRENTDVLRTPRGEIEAWWVPVQHGQEGNFEDYLYRTDREGRRIRIPESQREVAIRDTVRHGEKTLEILVRNDPFNVDGHYLVDAARDYDSAGKPCVAFQFDAAGARLFGRLTSLNLPDEVQNFYRKLGIVLDGKLYSAPRIKSTIYDRGVIEGSFTQQEVDDLVRVLNAGSLPTALKQEPISRLVTGPTLGHDTIVKGCWAIGVSAALVLLFMLVYYRFAGIVACAALLVNLVLILAIMMTVGAALTLPGLAGLVLTVGMAVDANVLIFERLREELGRGAALRMVIRNGFGRATTTIVDANLTTLITGVILFVVGTDQVKGFAITLILGVVLSMYTAIFCSRVVFDIAERRRWITELTMMRIVGDTQIDFLGWRRLCVAGSLALIVVGLVAVAWRGAGLLDIDFTGGVSVVTVFDKPQEIADVRKAAGGLPDLAVSGIQLEDEPRGTWFQINTSQSEVDHEQLTEWAVKRVQQQLEKAFGAEANTPTRRQALEAFRKQVVQTLETKPGTAPRDAAVQTLHQRLADLFAGASQSPGLGSTLDTLQWQVNRLVRVNTATDFVEEYLHEELPGRLASNSMRFGELMGIGSAESEAAKASPEGPAHPPATDQTRGDLPGDRVLAMAGEAPVLPPPAKATGDSPAAAKSALPKKTPAAAAGKPAAEGPPSGTAPEGAPAPPPQARAKSAAGKVPASSPAKPAEPAAKPVEPSGQAAGAAEPAIDPFAGGTEVQLTFARKVSYDTILEIFTTEFGSKDALPPLQLAPLVESSTPGEPPKPDKSFAIGDSTPYTMWNVKIKLPPQQATARLDAIKAAVADTPFFPSSNTIGGKVAGSTRMQAVYALLASLLCIVAYLWVRFQRVIFGLAAVVALVHDVLITLGAIAISAFLAPYLGFLLIDPFKIGLPVLAAFLTIIGYSLNDTIIVFDRIREVRGKAPRLTEDMVNASVNQTLSRTLLTSGTTLLVIVVLYIAGGEVIHGFAFSLLVGVIVGTYSSIYIASPVLLWMVRPPKTRQIGNPRN